MDNIPTPWRGWCLLCAKENPENSISVHLQCRQTAEQDVKLTLREALKKYFCVQSSCEDLFPKHLCVDCYSLISSIMLFNEHVERVQKMYKFLVENPNSCDLQSARLKFSLGDVNRGQWCRYQNKISDTVSENYQNRKNNSGAERFTARIEPENWTIESDNSEYEDNTDVYNECIFQNEELRQEEQISNDSQEETEDLVDEDSFWSEEEEKIDHKGNTQPNKRTSGIPSSDANTERKTKHESKPRDNLMKKKRNITEDFVLDVACTICKQKFDLYSSYCEHMEVSHDNANTDKQCPFCDRNIQTWYHLGRHMRLHMPLESRYPIKCPECDNRYTTSAQLEVHINHKHRNKKPFICEVCGFCGGNKNSLTQHMYVHTDNAPFECEVCKKRFKKRSRLNFHMDIHAPNKFICSICGLQLNSRVTLKNHLVVHSDEKRHKCDYCGACFKRSYYLKNHLILHTGLRPYSCNFCDVTYSNRTNCRGHMRKKHPEELALMDSSGNKAYTKNVPKLETLKAATKSGDNLRPIARSRGRRRFGCNFCDCSFTLRSNCRVHMRRKHPKEYALLDDCDDKTSIHNAPKVKRRMTVANLVMPKDPNEPVKCVYCDRTFGNYKYCRSHIRRIHYEELESLDTPSDTKNTTKLEALSGVIKVEDNVTLQSMEETTSPLDLQSKSTDDNVTLNACASSTATNIRNTTVNSSSPNVFLITIPGYPTVSVSQ